MSNKEKLEVAKRYVDKQLATLKKYGAAPKKLSRQEYQILIQQIAATVRC